MRIFSIRATISCCFPTVVHDVISIVDGMLGNESALVAIFSELSGHFNDFHDRPRVQDEILLEELSKYFSNTSIDITYGAAKKTIMQADPVHDVIFINPAYFACADSSEVDKCRLLLVVKLLHEVSHLLTRTFFKLAKVVYEKTDIFLTPSKIGRSIDSRGMHYGDCGFGMEELVFGGRLVASNHSELPFSSQLRLIQLDVAANKFRHKTLLISDSYLSRFMDIIIQKSFSPGCFLIAAEELSDVSTKKTDITRKKRKAACAALFSYEQDMFSDEEDVNDSDSEISHAIHSYSSYNGRKT